MSRYPRAIWKPLPESGSEFSATRRRLLVFHTIVGSAQSAYNYFRDQVSLESHLILPKQGPPWQIMEFSDTADANYRANSIAISVETEDNGDPAHDPWTGGQLDELVAFGVWCVQNPDFDIPAQRATGPFGTGIGYHAMWGAPSDWTPSSGKTCPGAARIRQFDMVVLPRIIAEVTGTQEDDMTPTESAQLAEIALRVKEMHAGNYVPGGDLTWLDVRVGAILSAIAGIDPATSDTNVVLTPDQLDALAAALSARLGPDVAADLAARLAA